MYVPAYMSFPSKMKMTVFPMCFLTNLHLTFSLQDVLTPVSTFYEENADMPVIALPNISA